MTLKKLWELIFYINDSSPLPSCLSSCTNERKPSIFLVFYLWLHLLINKALSLKLLAFPSVVFSCKICSTLKLPALTMNLCYQIICRLASLSASKYANCLPNSFNSQHLLMPAIKSIIDFTVIITVIFINIGVVPVSCP